MLFPVIVAHDGEVAKIDIVLGRVIFIFPLLEIASIVVIWNV